MNRLLIILSILCAVVFTNCYSFKGISIPQGVNTYYISDVELLDLKAPAQTPITFRETLRGKIRNQSSLSWTDTDPQVEFICAITKYDILTESAGEDATVQLNKLRITVDVEYITNYDEEGGWKKQFNYNRPFDANSDLSQIQDGLINEIFDELTEQIFNQAFAQW